MGFDGFGAEEEPFSYCLVGSSLGHECQYFVFSGGEVGEIVLLSTLAEQGADDVGVDDRTSRPDPGYGFCEVGEVGDSVFEEVADAGGVVSEKSDRLTGFHMMG
jgi:hypothetical protein